jgi:hypothetical protein
VNDVFATGTHWCLRKILDHFAEIINLGIFIELA